MTARPTVFLVKGSDTVLVRDEVTKLVAQYADGEAGLTVEDFAERDATIEPIIDACVTPPFLSDRRIVVVREVERFAPFRGGASPAGGDDDEIDDDEDDEPTTPSTAATPLEALLAYLGDPLDTTVLIMATEGKAVSAKLTTAVKKAGQVIDTEPPRTGKARAAWFDQTIAAAPVRLTPDAVGVVREHVGENAGLLTVLLERLAAVYGEGSKVDGGQIAPHLGEVGGVPPWDLTDAIDRGDTDKAVSLLVRFVVAGDRHPLQVVATLQNHYARALAVHGRGYGEAAAAEKLKVAPFQAKKAIELAERFGFRNVMRSLELVQTAELQLKGAGDSELSRIAFGPEPGVDGLLVLEVLVARLSRLAPRTTASGRRRSR